MSRRAPSTTDFLLYFVQSFYLLGLVFAGGLVAILPASFEAKLVGILFAAGVCLTVALVQYRARYRRETRRRERKR